MSISIVKGSYNPGMNPFAPQPLARFRADGKLGDAGLTYEFNVKIQKIDCEADFVDWDIDRQMAYQDFEEVLRRKYPFFTLEGFTGRSGGWLAIQDPQGRMTEKRLETIQKMVGAALKQFKKDMIAAYPRKVEP
jgi:hypothetical protein